MSIDEDTGFPMFLNGCLRTNIRELGLTNATICGCMGKDLCNGSELMQPTVVSLFVMIIVTLKFN